MTSARLLTTAGLAIVLSTCAVAAQAQQNTVSTPAPQTDLSSSTAATVPMTAPTAPRADSEQTVQTTTTAAGVAADGVTVVSQSVANTPVPDTAANRAKYGQPLSRTGQQTDPAGN